MKRRDMANMLTRNGWWIKRSGGNHEIWTNGTDNEVLSWSRVIPDIVVQKIIKRRGLV